MEQYLGTTPQGGNRGRHKRGQKKRLQPESLSLWRVRRGPNSQAEQRARSRRRKELRGVQTGS